MKFLRQAIILLLGGFGIVFALAGSVYAQAYGQGAYSCSTYSNGMCQAGSILPATGPQLLAILSAICLALGIGIYIWRRQRKARTAS